MGLTTMAWSRYFWVSALGMAPGTMVYVNAGAELSAIDSLDGVLAPDVLLAFVLLAALPWLAKSGSQGGRGLSGIEALSGPSIMTMT